MSDSETRRLARAASRTTVPRVTARKRKAKKRDARAARREATERKLVEAVGAVLRAEGVAAVGVNAVAAAAGVDKVLIYRYFDGLEGLLKAYGRSADFWPTLDEVLGPERDALALPPAEMARVILRRYAAALRGRPVTLDLLAWECVERNPLTVALEEARDQWSDGLLEEVAAAGFPLGPRTGAIVALFAAATNYLAVRGRELRIFSAVPIAEDDHWDFLATVMGDAVAGVLASEP
ncbi:MAG: TetR family transcriptional regulator [Sandaracinus sp.]|nr:TetR family transcriptional regulator [Myxococcales bacterium]MAT29660.1 TetR family transcriptional regulator [Sandaracinus sp.]MBJ71413.1 TetR family transcriptional regulator [Sandaracinus sp.]HJL22999.1 TetR family transcriptional regulator [Polyangiaceae bacterium LLY-WYZ-15_(1-7)]